MKKEHNKLEEMWITMTLKSGLALTKIMLSIILVLTMLGACSNSSVSSNSALSPVDVVNKHLVAQKNNDVKAWLATLASGNGFTDDKVLGVTSMKIIEVKNETDPKYMEKALKSEAAKKYKWTEDNFAFVCATFNVQHDHTLVPDKDGQMKWVYTLVRSDKKSPWLIKDWGYGAGGV